ncbi:haloacid dehalogenase [Haloferula helveola]|uniref:Haloacid dehalogenase n=1 Tax=Haloferula helveola TaxID=490095 RepID=A0ABM7REM3_9BACT|nr:haloacid dehalogenase [Haloferula helveola]
MDESELRSRFGSAFRGAGDPDFGAHRDGDRAEREWWRKVVELSVGNPVSDQAFDALFRHYDSGTAWLVRKEAVSALELAADSGLRLTVVSNFDLRLHNILRDLKLAGHFEVIVTSADARARKPSPQIFRQALSRLGLDAHQVLHIGDSPGADLEGARASGIEGFLLEAGRFGLADFVKTAVSRNRK